MHCGVARHSGAHRGESVRATTAYGGKCRKLPSPEPQLLLGERVMMHRPSACQASAAARQGSVVVAGATAASQPFTTRLRSLSVARLRLAEAMLACMLCHFMSAGLPLSRTPPHGCAPVKRRNAYVTDDLHRFQAGVYVQPGRGRNSQRRSACRAKWFSSRACTSAPASASP